MQQWRQFFDKTGGGDKKQNPNIRNVNVTFNAQGLDISIPTIPKPNKGNIKAGFKFKVLQRQANLRENEGDSPPAG